MLFPEIGSSHSHFSLITHHQLLLIKASGFELFSREKNVLDICHSISGPLYFQECHHPSPPVTNTCCLSLRVNPLPHFRKWLVVKSPASACLSISGKSSGKLSDTWWDCWMATLKSGVSVWLAYLLVCFEKESLIHLFRMSNNPWWMNNNLLISLPVSVFCLEVWLVDRSIPEMFWANTAESGKAGSFPRWAALLGQHSFTCLRAHTFVCDIGLVLYFTVICLVRTSKSLRTSDNGRRLQFTHH